MTIRRSVGDDITVAVHGGFLSVTKEGVTILAERGRSCPRRSTSPGPRLRWRRPRSEDDESAALRAESRLRAVGADV